MKAIYEVGSKLSLVITLPDEVNINKSGRVFLDDFCLKKKIPLVKNSDINNPNIIRLLKKNKIEWLLIIGWSQIAKKDLLEAPSKGCIGIHPTLLPIGRGRSPIPWAILKGLKKTGVTLFKINTGVDSGPIILQKTIKMKIKENATNLYEKVKHAHVSIIKSFIPKLVSGKFKLKYQKEEDATYWIGRKPKDGEINFHESVFTVEKLIRATTKPYPGAFYIKNNKKIIIWEAHISKKVSKGKNCLKFKDGYLNLDNFEIINL
jgi:methionyl-tRNA formyltransferase